MNSLASSPEQMKLANTIVNGGYISIRPDADGCEAVVSMPDGEKSVCTMAGLVENEQFFVDAKKCRCTCGECTPEPGGMCRHVLAAAMLWQDDYIRRNFGESSPGLRRIDSAALAEHVRQALNSTSDDCITSLLNRCTLAPQLSVLNRRISLVPTASILRGRMALSFRVGEKRMYVVKSLADFAEAVRSSAHVTYGKSFGFTHHIDSFCDEDKPLVDFVCACSERGSGGRYDPRSIELSGRTLDDFTEAYRRDTLHIERLGSENEYRVVRGDPELSFSVGVDSGGTCCIRIKDNIEFSVRGAKRSVVLFKDVLYFCSPEFTADVLPLAESMRSTKRSMRIASDDAGAFVTYVVPQLEKSAHMETDEALNAFRPPELDARLYINRLSDMELSADLRLCYGDMIYHAFGREIPHRGDFTAEQTIRSLVMEIFEPCRIENDVLIRRADDDFLFDFERSGRERLEKLCKLYCDDELRLRIKRSGSVSVGVRIESGLLRMSIDMPDEERAELAGILESLHAKKKYHRLKSGEFLSLEGAAVAELSGIADGLDLSAAELSGGEISMPAYRAVYLDAALKSSSSLTFDRDADFRRIARTVRAAADSDYELPEEVNASLRSYQRAGYRWLMALSDAGFGGILADDMGLGKTLQVLTVLTALKEKGCRRPSITVCPASLVLNWQNEAARFAPTLRTAAVLGGQFERAELIEDTLKNGGANLIITSYDSLKRDIELYESFDFECVIADEAQYMKNHNTQNARAVKLLRGSRRFALTGTPIENSLAELWSIFDFIMPGYLFSYNRFRQRYELPIVRFADDNAAVALRLLASPFILRRLKKDVLRELPPKTETVIAVEPGEEQRRLYIAHTLEAQKALASMAGRSDRRFEILGMLLRLRQICCDPSLVYEDYTGGSAKLDMCMELIHQCMDSGNKLLLFSFFTSMLDIIENRLDSEGIRYYRLTGDTPVGLRQHMVDSFNSDDVPVFLISLKAGGTGLNLTGASCVIHYDPWWNVSAQNQATDRAYRIGQRSAVQVFKLVVRDSIEERIMELQKSKSDLVDKVIEADQAALSALSIDELMSLLETHGSQGV